MRALIFIISLAILESIRRPGDPVTLLLPFLVRSLFPDLSTVIIILPWTVLEALLIKTFIIGTFIRKPAFPASFHDGFPEIPFILHHAALIPGIPGSVLFPG